MMPSRPSRGPVRRPGVRRGFTLLELMVTLVLVGLVTSFAMLSLQSESPGERQQQEARRLLARMDLAREEALLRMRSLGIRLGDDGYRFVEHVDGQWRALQGRGFTPHELASELRLEVDLEGREIAFGGGEDGPAGDENERPQIFFLAGGEVIPQFTIRLISDATMTEYRVHPGAERWLALSRDDL